VSSANLLKIVGHSGRGAVLICCAMLIGTPQVMAGDPVNGGKIYNQQCKKCHGANGKSVLPGVADFSRGEGLLKADSELLKKIRNGGGMMPAYRGTLKDSEILDVITYLRKLRR